MQRNRFESRTLYWGGVCQKKQDQVLSVNLSDAQLLNGRGLSSPIFVFLE